MQRAREVAEGRRKQRAPQGRRERHCCSTRIPAGRRSCCGRRARRRSKKTRGHYPALLAAIEAVAAGYEKGTSHGYREESRLFGEMAMTDVSKQLIFLFFATNALKKDPGVEPAQHPDLPVAAFEPLPVEKIAILGAGFMGAGIASVAVQHGSLVRLKDADHARVAKGFAAVRDVLKERLTKKQITRVQYSDYMALLGGTVDYSGFGNVDLVIEAVFEDLTVKHQVLREVGSGDQPSAIFAIEHEHHSNCADRAGVEPAGARARDAFLLSRAQDAAARGHHHRATRSAGDGDGSRLRKEAGQDSDRRERRPGLLRQPHPLAVHQRSRRSCSTRAWRSTSIDKALVDFGFPVGPITLIDEVGLDVASKAGKIMAEAYRRSDARRRDRFRRSSRRDGTGENRRKASTATTRKGRRERSIRPSTRCSRAGTHPGGDVHRASIGRAAGVAGDAGSADPAADGAADAQRSGALPQRWNHPVAARWRCRRGIRDRLPAVSRRTVPLHGHARRENRGAAARGSQRALSREGSSRRSCCSTWPAANESFYPDERV